jgi:hypothetical protein
MRQVRATTPSGVVTAIVSRVLEREGRVRVIIDGAEAADPDALGAAVVEALAPRSALHVRADRFWRPAGQRFEYGKQDPDAYLDLWLDVDALRREVLDPFPTTGRVLPGLRDPQTDRSLRAAQVELPDDGVVVLSGSVLLGRWLDADLSVHLRLTPAALRRRTPEDRQWTLAALERYAEDNDPESAADLVVRCDDPRHPALEYSD